MGTVVQRADRGPFYYSTIMHLRTSKQRVDFPRISDPQVARHILLSSSFSWMCWLFFETFNLSHSSLLFSVLDGSNENVLDSIEKSRSAEAWDRCQQHSVSCYAVCLRTYFFSAFVNATRANHDLIYPSISAPNWLVEHRILGAGGFTLKQKFLCPPPLPSQRRTNVLGGRGTQLPHLSPVLILPAV